MVYNDDADIKLPCEICNGCGKIIIIVISAFICCCAANSLQSVNDNQLRVRVLSYKSGDLIFEPFAELLCPGGEDQIVTCFLLEHPIQTALESGVVIFQGEV